MFYTAKDIEKLYKAEKTLEIERTISHPLIIDDLGAEEVSIKCYGTTINPLVDLISERYVNQMRAIDNGDLIKFTYLSTNLRGQVCIDRYGERIMDRMTQMCKIIKMEGESKRK